MANFDIEFLDHVAIRVKDLEKSADWYEKVLGLQKYQPEEWGAFPIFMLAGKSGVALFPEKELENKKLQKEIKTDHFAFNVNRENFEKAKAWLEELKISYQFQDHFYFHSIYIEDPDDYTVELTTIVVDEANFYKRKS